MKRSTLLIVISFFVTLSIFATNITGSVSTNTTWTSENSPYIIVNSIDVNPGVTLTIESGVTVMFNSGRYIQVRGTMNATAAIFTANGTPAKGFWDGIYVSYEYSETGNVNLNNCTVEYASNLYARKGALTLSYCTINNLSGSVRVSSLATLNIDNTTVSNTNFPVTLYGDGILNAGNNVVFSNNAYNYVDLDFYEINKNLYLKDFGYPYFNDNSLVVRASGELTIDPGVNLQIQNTEISVYGKIKAKGTKQKPIVFSKTPAAGYWLGLNIYNTSIDTACVLKNCEFKNASYNHEWYCGLEIENASPTVDSCKFSDNLWNMNIQGISAPVISNCNFGPSIQASGEAYNISVDMNVNANFIDNSISFNNVELRAIRIRPSNVVNKGHLRKISFKEINNITYCLYETTTVLDTASLIIDPGVVIKCRHYYAYLLGNGKITGIGTEEEPIVFTHLGDDNYGNPLDTQNDEIHAQSNSNSGRIMLYSTSESKLEYWKINYGGYNADNWAVYVSNSNVLNKCELKNSYNAVMFTQNAKITNNKFTNITNYPLGYQASQGTPDLSGNTQLNCGYKGIVLEGIDNDSPTLKKLNFAELTNMPYILTHAVTVATGNTLTINPGIVIKSHYFGNRALLINGGLKALGTKNEKIIFTSINDDAVNGDTNNDGTASVPGYTEWNGIEFTGTSDDAVNLMRNCEVKYAGNMWYNPAPIQISDCRVVLDSVKINFANNCGLGIFGNANPEIKDCEISNVSWEPIYMDIFSKPTFTGTNKLSNVGDIAVKLRGGIVSGTLPSINFTGYNPITYILYDETVTVNDELIIPEGITVKGSGRWNIYGKLTINGTAEKPVVFTTVEDDRYGNPKDGQQNGTTGLNYNGGYFVFYETANDQSLINHTIFAYSRSYPISLSNSSPTIQNCTFDNINKEAIVLNGNSAPAINNCKFNNVSYPLYTSMLAYPSSTLGNVIQGSTGKGIRLYDETLTQNVTLKKRNFGGIDNIPWIIGNYTVGSSAKLTIEPGVILKFLDYGYINVSNGLIAKGGSTPDSTIIFTTVRDDLYGGDTYNNGTADGPWNYSWRGIYFSSESIDEDCMLKNCIFRYASYPNDRGAITMDNASPSILNCKFDMGYHGILTTNYSLPVINNCDFSNSEYNSGYSIWNKSTIVNLIANNCWFNSSTGPRHSTNPAGTGDRISDNVTFVPFNAALQNAELGDVSMNGTIQPYDASLILQHAVSNIVLNPAQQKVADVSKNESISSYDASLILQYNVGLILSFTNTGASLVRRKIPAIKTSINFAELSNSPVEKEFIVPVNITSATGISSLDMKLEFNPNHISLINVSQSTNSNALLSFTEKAENGHLSVSVASAYDLAFDNQPVYLKFKLNNSTIEESELKLISAIANDDRISDLSSTFIASSKIISGLENLKPENFIKVWNDNELIYLSINSPELIQMLNVRILGESGKTISNFEYKNFAAGNQLIKIPLTKDFNLESGIYLMQILLDNNSIITKKIVIK